MRDEGTGVITFRKKWGDVPVMPDDIMKQFDLRGRVAVITGAGGALCGNMAEALALVGVHVAVLDIHLEKARAREEAIGKAGGAAKAFGCDVLDETQLRQCYREICSLWGQPDFLINGAGGNDPRGTTTREFLDFFGISALTDLPIPEPVDDEDIVKSMVLKRAPEPDGSTASSDEN